MTEKANYIITGATSQYYKSFLQLVHSYKRFHESRNSKIIFYDLGLSEENRLHLNERLQVNHQEIEFRVFDFSKYPDFVHPHFMTYSWKPIIINEVLEQKKGNVLWMDTANIILKNLKPIWDAIEETGFYTPFSGSGSLAEWTMPQTLDYMNVSTELYTFRNRCGGLCGFSYSSMQARSVTSDWEKYALIKECIKPDKANRTNHRDDQSILTILLSKIDTLNEESILTQDEVDISSASPNPYVSVRNNADKKTLLPPGRLSTSYFWLARQIDIFINKIKKCY